MGEAEVGAEVLVLDGGARMQRRGGRSGDISEEQIETFLITLAETCNVVRSARAAGFSANWAYRKRRHDASFRTGWARAVREGYAKLELVLLERAMKGTPKAVGGGTSDRVIREYSTALAVALLRRHADTAGEPDYDEESDEISEARERIVAKLERLRLRDEKEAGQAGVETKGAFNRVETICWALRRAAGRDAATNDGIACAAPDPGEPSSRACGSKRA